MKVGILGGGQLAQMLAEAALKLGLDPIAFSAERDCPAAQFCSEIVTSLPQFLKMAEVVTFENEFVDCDELQRLTSGSKTKFFPPLSTIRTLQDKLKQKQLLQSLKISTSEFRELNPREFRDSIENARKFLGEDAVLKWSRLGYDGKGVFFLKDSLKSSPKVSMDRALDFCHEGARMGVPVFAERRIRFKRELAILTVAQGSNVIHYPLVLSEQRDGICKRVTGPATALGIDATLQTTAEKWGAQVAQATAMSGCFALEFFEDESGRLWVNEIAPRVHNSGHYTQEAFAASQFENHWNGILGRPLAPPELRAPFFGMLNLIGNVKSPKPQPPACAPGISVHWYQKRESRPGRKMGHLNGTAASAKELQKLLKAFEKCEDDWIESLKEEIPREKDQKEQDS